MSDRVTIDGLNEAISQELTIYSSGVASGIKTQSKKHMAQLVKKTKATAPVGHRKKHYRDNISSKKLNENEYGATYMWYVKAPDYRLSHLLEHGHAKRNGGRVSGTGFIRKATEPILESYEQAVEEVIKNGK